MEAGMRRDLIDQFFIELDRELACPADIILTGAAAGTLMGSSRPSLDIDFEIRLKETSKEGDAARLAETIEKVMAKTGIAADYSSDIGHWSMIDHLDYRNKTIPYKQIGRLEIKHISPAYWTLGKLARFLAVDIQDLVRVIRKNRLNPERLVKLWAEALVASPPSLSWQSFRRQAKEFLKNYGKSAWGRGFDAEKVISLFETQVRLKYLSRRGVSQARPTAYPEEPRRGDEGSGEND